MSRIATACLAALLAALAGCGGGEVLTPASSIGPGQPVYFEPPPGIGDNRETRAAPPAP